MFTSFVIIDTLFTWAAFRISKLFAKRRESIKIEEGKILMNEKITAWKLNVYIENFYFNLNVCRGIPLLLPLSFINLLSKYLSNRYLVQNYSYRREGLDENLILFLKDDHNIADHFRYC